jgi:hypothetical protein
MKTLLVALIAAFSAAIKTNREDSAELAKVKAQNNELIEKLRQEDLEDAEIEELAPQIEEVLRLAAAARPPTEDQITIAGNSLSGVGVSQDPAQPPGSPAPGNPEVEKQLAEGTTEESEETDDDETPEQTKEERIEALVNENSKEGLVKLANKAQLEVGAGVTKREIAEAIVNAEENDDNGK